MTGYYIGSMLRIRQGWEREFQPPPCWKTLSHGHVVWSASLTIKAAM